MSVWKKLRLFYLLFLLAFAAAAFVWFRPLFNYLRQPVEFVESPAASSDASALAGGSSQEEPSRSINPRSLLGVSAATLPKFEGMVERIAPKSAQAWVGLGILYQFKDLSVEAERCYRKALTFDTDHPDAHYRLGSVLQATNRLAEAIQEYETALRVRPGYVPAYYSLAAVYQAQGRLSDAEFHYREILRMHPKEYQARNNLGIIQEQKGNLAEAVKEYAKAVEMNPNDPVVKNNLEMSQRDLASGRVTAPAVIPGAPVAATATEPPALAPAAVVPKPEFKPEKISTVYLKNAQIMSGEVVSRDAKGLWFRIDEGTKFYLSSDEIARVE